MENKDENQNEDLHLFYLSMIEKIEEEVHLIHDHTLENISKLEDEIHAMKKNTKRMLFIILFLICVIALLTLGFHRTYSSNVYHDTYQTISDIEEGSP